MNNAGFLVMPDTRWPTCPENGPVLKAVWPNDNSCFLGWWTEAEFQEWLQRRDGSITQIDGDKRTIVALLTKKEIATYRPDGRKR